MKKKQKGFTLIELVITVVIVGILSLVSVPIYQYYVERARLTEAISNLRAIADANIFYYLENKTWCKDIRELPIKLEGTAILEDKYWRIENDNFVYACVGDSADDTIATVNRKPYHQRYWISLRVDTKDEHKLVNYGLYGDVYSGSLRSSFDKGIINYYQKKFPRR